MTPDASNWLTTTRAAKAEPRPPVGIRKSLAHGSRTRRRSLVIGRRGGKSLMMAPIAAYLACFFD
jgi:hypothetical protein